MKKRNGFTIIEVVLFLAVSALMFVGLVANTHSNISGQRYSASVQDFAVFLRRVYNEVEDTQIYDRNTLESKHTYCTVDAGASVSVGRSMASLSGDNRFAAGRTECAVYGKLVVFGESDTPAIHVYDVIGDAVDAKHPLGDTSSELNSYKSVHMGVLMFDDLSSPKQLRTSSYSYSLEWGAWVENSNSPSYSGGNAFIGALLIVRSPLSGTVHTFFRNANSNEVDISGFLETPALSSSLSTANYAMIYNSVMNSRGSIAKFNNTLASFAENEINFCINSEDRGRMKRRNVRLTEKASSSADIILVAQDGEENECLD